jgi:hypothetical protein
LGTAVRRAAAFLRRFVTNPAAVSARRSLAARAHRQAHRRADEAEGCFAIADISGYTHFVFGVGLDHAQDIIPDIMDTLVRALRPPLQRALQRAFGGQSLRSAH